MLASLSPLDGRYRHKLEPLIGIMSEVGYMQRRVHVEVVWLLALTEAPWTGLVPLSISAKEYLLSLALYFTPEDARAIQDIEKTTKHDVKAVEYWLKQQCARHPESIGLHEWVHFACTSEDINNVSHALQLRDARELIIAPELERLIALLQNMAHRFADVAMLSRTHGQNATPTTVGKEFANVVARLRIALTQIKDVKLKAKLNGAVGNYNAHLVAYPDVSWDEFAKSVIETPFPAGLGLSFQDYSTQIEPHDYIAQLFDAIARTNTICLDLSRDMWGYISLGYFKQRIIEGEVGSSTMPHKINPIDFENAEGNLGLSNALLRHMSDKLPVSRWQRDLSDSTVLRNMGVAIGHAVLAYQSLSSGLAKMELNAEEVQSDLNTAWEVLAEPIQTVMRKAGVSEPYEQLKTFTQGKKVTEQLIRDFIESLELPEQDKERLRSLTPETYTGMAATLAKKI